MAFSTIQQRMANYGANDLIAALPADNLMTWVTHPAATPPTALVIGTCDGQDILAFMKSFGGSPRRVQYCLKPASRRLNASTAKPLTLDEVVKLPLIAPFRYSADISELGKSNLGIVIQWYFMGKIEPEVDFTKYCLQLDRALQRIDANKHAGKESGRPEPEKPRGGQDERSARHSHPDIKAGTTGQLVAPIKRPVKSSLVSMSDDEHSDLDKLHNYLDSHGALSLLENLPDLDEVQFIDQDFLSDAQPRKLLMGFHEEKGNDIYAYMRKSRKYHEIKFFIEDNRTSSKTAICSEDVAKQRILHPFDKTYPKVTRSIGQDEKARLTLMVKWYFIAAGIAKNCVLKETKTYPKRLRSALEYIAKQMSAASVRPPLIGYERQLEPENTSKKASPDIDKSKIRSTLANITPNPLLLPIKSRTAPLRASTTHVEQLDNSPSAVDAPGLRGTKRTAEDAEFGDLAEIVFQVLNTDRDLKDQIDDIDKQIEVLQKKRKDLIEKRKDEKRRSTRQTLMTASRTDE